MSTYKGTVVDVVTTPVGSTNITESAFAMSNNGTLHSGGTSGPVPSRLTIAQGEWGAVSVAVIVT